MTALAADRQTSYKEVGLKSYPCGVDVIYKGGLVGIPTDGYVEALVLGTTPKFAGVAAEQKDNSAGSNGTLDIKVYTRGVFKFAATSITQAMVGQMMYAVDDQTFDDTPGDYGVPVGILVEYVSATEGWIDIGPALAQGGVSISKIVQTVAIGDFTDNTDTTGYVDLDDKLPAGAIPLGTKIEVTTGFTGDTTAVVQVGIAGDLDRFTLNTDQSVLAAATVGSLPATDGCDGMNAAQTVRVTVTGGADFGNISAGSMIVTLYYARTE